MSHTVRLLFLLFLALILGGCSLHPQFPLLDSAVASTEARRILVTFVDRSIERDLPSSSMDRYRARGMYGESSWSRRVASNLAQKYGLTLAAEWPVTALGVACVVYEVPASRSVEDILQQLAQDREVESAQRMRQFKVSGHRSDASPAANDPYFPLQSALQVMRVDAVHQFATGKGNRIAVIDTGVDLTHPDLVGQVSVSENLATVEETAGDIHGTAVAGVIAARQGNGVGIVGVAPDAEILALKACWPERAGDAPGVCNSFTLALALNEALRLNASIINLSLTGPEDPLVRRLLDVALQRGIFVVVSDSGEASAGKFPAMLAGVIAVRTEGFADEHQSTESIHAPGTRILTTLPSGTYDFMSGSSFAAPHVSGVLALMREIKPAIKAPEALSALRRSLVVHEVPRPFTAVDACLALMQVAGRELCPSQTLN